MFIKYENLYQVAQNFQLNANEQITLMAIISHQNNPVSQSEISRKTLISTRSISTIIQRLEQKGVLSKRQKEARGTIFDFDPSIKEVFFAQEIGLQVRNTEQQNFQNKSSIHNVNRLDEIEKELKSLRSKVSIKDMMKGKNKEIFDRIESLVAEKESLITPEQEKIIKKEEKPSPKPQKEIATPIPHAEKKNAPKRLTRTLVKGIFTRLKKLPYVQSEQQIVSLAKQIVWSIKEGWYKDKQMTTFHCINDIFRRLKQNTWKEVVIYNPRTVEFIDKVFLTWKLSKAKKIHEVAS